MAKSVIVFDKTKYHLEGDFPEDLSPDQASVQASISDGWSHTTCCQPTRETTLGMKYRCLNNAALRVHSYTV